MNGVSKWLEEKLRNIDLTVIKKYISRSIHKARRLIMKGYTYFVLIDSKVKKKLKIELY